MFYEVGYNQYNVGDFNGLFYDSLHAEVDAMTKLKPNRKELQEIEFAFKICTQRAAESSIKIIN